MEKSVGAATEAACLVVFLQIADDTNFKKTQRQNVLLPILVTTLTKFGIYKALF